MRPLCVILIGVCFVILFHLPGWAERGIVVGSDQGSRVALVIGNGEYKRGRLQNPVYDARDMRKTLEGFGFKVSYLENADLRAMEDAVRDFGSRLPNNGVALFYFAGHGLQVQGDNYLVPIGARIQREADVRYEAMAAGWVLGNLYNSGRGMNLIVLDACRNNPYSRGFRSQSTGLAQMRAPTGTFIAYATAPGKVAADGSGRNGVFTKHLLDQMQEPDRTVERVLKKTRVGVAQETQGKQVPWSASSLTGDFYFVVGGSDLPPKQELNTPFGRLTVIPSPADVRVRIMNITQPYSDGIELKPNTYHIRVDKQGYSTVNRWVEVSAGQDLNVSIELKRNLETGRLFVQTVPANAEVRLLNSDQRYYDGMEIEAGRYEIEVSSPGYVIKSQWINIGAGKNELSISLKKETATIETAAEPIPGKAWTEPITGMEFVWVPGGCYMMGSPLGEQSASIYKENLPVWQRAAAALAGLLPMGCAPVSRQSHNLGYASDETPAHEVCIDGFWMGKTEVTIDEYRMFLQTTDQASGVDWDDDDCPIRKGGSYWLARNKFGRAGNQPMVEVSWHGAKAFAEWLSRKTGKVMRLPTEAEWEYAARSGGKREKYAGGSDADKVAWYVGNSGSRTHRVGTKSANGLGLYDMSGNVWEWCEDRYVIDAYSRHTSNNPKIDDKGRYRIRRGGSWFEGQDGIRCAKRTSRHPESGDSYMGFRISLHVE